MEQKIVNVLYIIEDINKKFGNGTTGQISRIKQELQFIYQNFYKLNDVIRRLSECYMESLYIDSEIESTSDWKYFKIKLEECFRI